VTEGRSLGQAVAEGDGISPVALVRDAEMARRAEENGAEALAVVGDLAGVREATTLRILCYWSAPDLPVSAMRMHAWSVRTRPTERKRQGVS
jgi:hypothetical protein